MNQKAWIITIGPRLLYFETQETTESLDRVYSSFLPREVRVEHVDKRPSTFLTSSHHNIYVEILYRIF